MPRRAPQRLRPHPRQNPPGQPPAPIPGRHAARALCPRWSRAPHRALPTPPSPRAQASTRAQANRTARQRQVRCHAVLPTVLPPLPELHANTWSIRIPRPRRRRRLEPAAPRHRQAPAQRLRPALSRQRSASASARLMTTIGSLSKANPVVPEHKKPTDFDITRGGNPWLS